MMNDRIGVHAEREGAKASNCSYMYLNGVWDR